MEQLKLPEGKTKEEVDWIDVYEAASIMQCSRQNIQKHHKAGKFQVYWKDERGRLQLSEAEVREVSKRIITRGTPRKGKKRKSSSRIIAGQKVKVY